jgi:hypothetical protein
MPLVTPQMSANSDRQTRASDEIVLDSLPQYYSKRGGKLDLEFSNLS